MYPNVISTMQDRVRGRHSPLRHFFQLHVHIDYSNVRTVKSRNLLIDMYETHHCALDKRGRYIVQTSIEKLESNSGIFIHWNLSGYICKDFFLTINPLNIIAIQTCLVKWNITSAWVFFQSAGCHIFLISIHRSEVRDAHNPAVWFWRIS